MAGGFRGLLAPWAGGAGNATTAAGYRSLLAFWAGGATGVTPATAAGYRSLLAPWAGGASSVEPTSVEGYRSLLAFWAGGAANVGAVPEQRNPSAPHHAPPDWLDEEDLFEVAIAIIASGALTCH